MMKKMINFGFVVVVSMFIVSSPVYALTVDGGDTTSGDSSTPSVQDNGSTAGNDSTPDTQDNGSTAGDSSTPDVQDNGSTAGDGFTPDVQDNGSTAGSGSTPGTQDNGSTAGEGSGDNGNNGGGSSSGSSSGSRRNYASVITAIPTVVATPEVAVGSGCLYLVDFMSINKTNNPSEVTKLQTFLKNAEGLDVDVNGIFDTKTETAVKAFQAKYVDEIMAPWGVKSPTGQVYITTTKKINEIYCKSIVSLTADQIAEIEAYKVNKDSGFMVGSNGSSTDVMDDGTTTEVGSNASTSQTASVGGFWSRIWSFIKWLLTIGK